MAYITAEATSDGGAAASRETFHGLDPRAKVRKVAEFLEEAGGSVSVGIVGSKFGVKRWQLEATRFLLTPVGEHGQYDVSLPAATAKASFAALGKAFPSNDKAGEKGAKGKAFPLAEKAKGKAAVAAWSPGGAKGAYVAGGKGVLKSNFMMAKGAGFALAKGAGGKCAKGPLKGPGAQFTAGQQRSTKGGKGQEEQAPEAVPSLEDYQVDALNALLDANDGAVPVSAVIDQIDVKPVALRRSGFDIAAPPPGADGAGEKVVFRRDEPPLALALAEEKVAEILIFLQESGGKASAAVIGGRFRAGRAHLIASGFLLGDTDAHGQCDVIGFGGDVDLPERAEPMAERQSLAEVLLESGLQLGSGVREALDATGLGVSDGLVCFASNGAPKPSKKRPRHT